MNRSGGSNPAASARWTFDNLIPEQYYQVAVSYLADPSHTSAFYRVYVDGEELEQLTVNQRLSNFDFFADGVGWKIIQVLPAGFDELVIELDASGSGTGPRIVDAVRVQALEGRAGTDDDFHLGGSSPAIDYGNPSSPSLEEPQPNGARVNIGAYGNTAEAALSPDPLIQVLTPNGLEIVEAGATVPITWRSAGLTLTQPVVRINVGTRFLSGPVDDWIRDAYVTHTQYSTFDNGTGTPIDRSGVVNPAPELVYQYSLLSNSQTGSQFRYDPPGGGGHLYREVALLRHRDRGRVSAFSTWRRRV